MLRRLLAFLRLSSPPPHSDATPADPRKELGRIGEEAAAATLKRCGLSILKRNYTCTRGEIDIVALDGQVICFVEVKTRRPDAMLPPERSVTTAKRRQVHRVARHYLRSHDLQDRTCRFDIASVICPESGSGEPRVELFRNAF